MTEGKYCIAEGLSKRTGRRVMYFDSDVTAMELRKAGIEVFVEDLTYDEALALTKIFNEE
jgi:hypothetical protein